MDAGEQEWCDGLQAWKLEGLEGSKVETWAFRLTAVLNFSWARTWERCVSVRPSTVFPGNRSKDFAETWSEVKGGWMGNGDTAVFSVKNQAH